MQLIIARYNENTEWAKDYDHFIVQKTTEEEKGHLPNKGREPSSFLWYIIKHYNELEGDYAFLQGNPFDHAPHALKIIAEHKVGFQHIEHNGPLTCQPDGTPHDRGFNVNEAAAIMGLEPRSWYRFGAGGQFITSAKNIKKYTKKQYKELYEWVMEEPKRCYALERIWESLYKE